MLKLKNNYQIEQVYLLMCYIQYEDHTPMLSFKSMDEAKEVLKELEEYHSKKPVDYDDIDYDDLYDEWFNNHPAEDDIIRYSDGYYILSLPLITKR